MPILSIIIPLVIVGVLLFVLNSYIPMESRIKSIVNIIVILAVVLWLLRALGLFPGLNLS